MERISEEPAIPSFSFVTDIFGFHSLIKVYQLHFELEYDPEMLISGSAIQASECKRLIEPSQDEAERTFVSHHPLSLLRKIQTLFSYTDALYEIDAIITELAGNEISSESELIADRFEHEALVTIRNDLQAHIQSFHDSSN